MNPLKNINIIPKHKWVEMISELPIIKFNEFYDKFENLRKKSKMDWDDFIYSLPEEEKLKIYNFIKNKNLKEIKLKLNKYILPYKYGIPIILETGKKYFVILKETEEIRIGSGSDHIVDYEDINVSFYGVFKDILDNDKLRFELDESDELDENNEIIISAEEILKIELVNTMKEINNQNCSCGCGTCEDKNTITEAVNYHSKNNLSFIDNIFRPGSDNYIELWHNVRELYNEGLIVLKEEEKQIIEETDLGLWGEYEGKKVPLDFIMEDKIPGGLAAGMTLKDLAIYHDVELSEIKSALKKGIKVEIEHTTDKKIAAEIAKDHIYEDLNYYDKLQMEEIKTDILGSKKELKGKPLQYRPYDELLIAIGDNLGWDSEISKNLQKLFETVPVDITKIINMLKYYKIFDDYKHLINLNEGKQKKKTPQLNKPKRGGSKKFYVYVKDPKTKRIKKVSFGDTTGLSAKINNPKARQAFAKRHRCSEKTDRTKASYWSCRLPRYAKLLGLKSNFSGFW